MNELTDRVCAARDRLAVETARRSRAAQSESVQHESVIVAVTNDFATAQAELAGGRGQP